MSMKQNKQFTINKYTAKKKKETHKTENNTDENKINMKHGNFSFFGILI